MGYTIRRADEGGFYVTLSTAGHGAPGVAYAGSLGECLAYVFGKFSPAPE